MLVGDKLGGALRIVRVVVFWGSGVILVGSTVDTDVVTPTGVAGPS